jgi:IS1 family transposase
LNKSAIVRVKGIAWNTVHRWLERAAVWCRRFSDRKIRRFAAVELQADEIKTIVGGKEQPIWVFTVIDVCSRLWPSTMAGKRSYQNTLSLFRDLASRMNLEQIPLVVTDGFGFYEKVIGRVFGSGCLYGQVIKTRRNDRVGEGRAKNRAWRQVAIGTGAEGLGGLSEAKQLVCRTAESDDPTGLSLSGLTRRQLTFREIFEAGLAFLALKNVLFALFDWAPSVSVSARRMPLAA